MDGLYADGYQSAGRTRARTARAYGPLDLPVMRSGSDGDEAPREENASRKGDAVVARRQIPAGLAGGARGVSSEGASGGVSCDTR